MSAWPVGRRVLSDPNVARAVEATGWALLVAGVFVTVVDVVCGPWDHDAGYYLLRASYVADGSKPFLDYRSLYPPLVDLLVAPLLMIPVERIVLAIAVPILWILANTLATGFLAYVATGDRAISIVIASLFPLYSVENGGNHLTLEHGVALFSLLAFAGIVRRGPLTTGIAASMGLFASAALLSKQNGALTFLPVAAALLSRRQEVTRRHLVALIAGAAAIPLAILVWLEGNVAALHRDLVAGLGRYAAVSRLSLEPFEIELLRSPETVWLFRIAVVLAASIVIVSPQWRAVTIAAAIGAAGQFLPRLMRDYPHYNINIWPFLALIVIVAAAQANALRTIVRVTLPVVAVALYVSIVVNPRWPHPRWTGVSPLVANFDQAARVVRDVTPPDRPVRQYGAEPIIEFLAHRREEMIDKPEITIIQWDGRDIHTRPPHPQTTIVIVDTGQKWIPAVLAGVERHGFVTVARLDGWPKITILRDAKYVRPR